MNDEQLAKQHIDRINSLAKNLNRTITLMEICGGHTNVIMKYGIRELLPKNIRLISGPGCPVCVSSQHDIDCMIALAEAGIPVATYGDMLKVPGSKYSLEEIKAKKGNVFEVYSAAEVLDFRRKYPDMVFFGIGFETTAPMTAFLLKHKITVYSVHKLVPPAIKILMADKSVKIDGFIDPGHVSTIIGMEEYRKIPVPQVISGFEPEQILRSIATLVELIVDGKKDTINGYPEVVHAQGNRTAQKALADNFKIVDSEWRGLGVLPMSGLEVRDDALNAKIKYKDILKKVPQPKKSACRCGDVLKGIIEPSQCPLYRKVCTPEKPEGACMVSEEGSCAIYYRYGK